MLTYYAAQLGIALSVVDSKDSYDKAQAIIASTQAANGAASTSTATVSANSRLRRAIPQHLSVN